LPRSLLLPFLVIAVIPVLTGCDAKSTATSHDKKADGSLHLTADEKAAAQKLKAVRDPVLDEIYAYRKQIRLLYNNRRFDELEKEAADVRAAKSAFDNGSRKLVQFYDSLECSAKEPESMWQLHDQIHRDWIEKFPQSITARVAYAHFFTDYAWQARGHEYADKVTKDGWRLFEERNEAARKILEEAQHLPEKDPCWYRGKFSVALGQSWDETAYDHLVEEAKSFDPTFWGFDMQRANSLLPRWFGHPGEWESYAEDAAARPDGLGAEIYARIVMENWSYYDNVFQDTRIFWAKTREGLTIILQKYPRSFEFKNMAARLAGLAEDREFAQKMFGQLGDTYDVSIWKKPEVFVHCRAWAETGNR
jgi:hypothetical protein